MSSSLGAHRRGSRGTGIRVRRSLLGLGIVVLALVAAGVSWGATGYDPAADMNSMFNTTAYSGATVFWNAGYTGAGVDVAVIDTGVSSVAGLATPGKIVYGPDLSLESQNSAFRNLDTNGHGTFMAGLIAGHDSTLSAPYASAPASAYRGMAPDARIVSLKVGTADGGVDVSQVIAAIDWVVQHRYDNGMNIRVISLSYGTYSTQASSIDPLSFAAEQAWKKGIVVVAAAGNSGAQLDALADPAYNPYVIAAAASDSMGTASITDDRLGIFSAHAPSLGRAPDFAAPGAHLQGLRVPNSYLDVHHLEGLLGTRYFRGSGTSQAAAVISGMVALVLQKYPTLSPDGVKKFLSSSAYVLARTDRDDQGAGELQLQAMLSKTPAAFTQTFASGTGTGTLEAARGSDHLTAHGAVLSGERDIFGHAFSTSAMATAEAAGNSWSGGFWNGNSWSGNTWSGNSWSGNTWFGNSWSGNTWSGNTWSGNTWSGNTWSGNTWSGNSWSGSTWSGNTWSGGSWS